jgi:DNA-directed RNA polymerase subunit RPC12/RpoP
MRTGTFYGFKCPTCGKKVQVGLVLGGDRMTCEECNVDMVPDGQAESVLVNVQCKKCGTFIAMSLSPKCPTCGSKLR